MHIRNAMYQLIGYHTTTLVQTNVCLRVLTIMKSVYVVKWYGRLRDPCASLPTHIFTYMSHLASAVNQAHNGEPPLHTQLP